MRTMGAVRRMLCNYAETSRCVSEDEFCWERLRNKCPSRLAFDRVGRVSHNRLSVQVLDAVKDRKSAADESSQFSRNPLEKTFPFRIIFRHCRRPLRKKPISIPILEESTPPHN
jgi:hypothetical protein